MLILLLLLTPSLIVAAREGDRVHYLPGLDEQPEFKHYAGYLNATGSNRFFYWFVESENDPATDPVVLWLNGGPGCSSLTGFLVELGPWRVLPDGSGLEWFEQRWNKVANIIFLESPQCVGFSYGDEGDCTTSDDKTAEANHVALIDFFKAFPEYRNNEFYITGESYAGVYVPTLAARIVDDENFNFKGFAVGNAVTNRDTMDNALVPYMWGRGLIGTEQYYELAEACCENMNTTDCRFAENKGVMCIAQMALVYRGAWLSGLNPYNYLQDCYGGALSRNGVYKEDESSATVMATGAIPMNPEMYREYVEFVRNLAMTKDVRAAIPCTDTTDRETYLNKPEVREALHIPDSVKPWEPCSTLDYEQQYRDVAPQFLKVLNEGHRVLVFNGDLDMACNHLGDMWFVEDLDQQLLHPYKSWLYTGQDGSKQIAGYVTQYHNLVYNQVLGAGHFVPTDKPVPAYDMWIKFLKDEPY